MCNISCLPQDKQNVFLVISFIHLYLGHFVEDKGILNTSKQYKFLSESFLFVIKGSWIWRWSLWYLKTPCLRNATLRISRQATPSSKTAPLSPPSSTTQVKKTTGFTLLGITKILHCCWMPSAIDTFRRIKYSSRSRSKLWCFIRHSYDLFFFG